MMKKNVFASARILLFSDPHYSVNSRKSEEKWFPPVCDFLEKVIGMRAVERFLAFWDNVTQNAFKRVIEKAKQLDPCELVVGFGDYTPGANEKGMLTKEAQAQYSAFADVLDGIVECPKRLVWGDHDIGYRFAVGEKTGVRIGTESGGVSVESVEIATRLIGPPFGYFSIGAANFIFISTNLIRNVDWKSGEKLRRLQFDQENFLAKTLYGSAGNTFLLLHDPTALGKETAIRKIMDSHRGKITAIVHGHLHAEFSRLLTRLSPVYGGLCREYETILVPASWGMMGIGGGFKVLNLYKDGTYEVETYKV